MSFYSDALAATERPRSNPKVAITGFCDECSLIEEADHRIANNLQLLASFVHLKALDLTRQPAVRPEPTREAVQLLLEGIRTQIEAIACLHRSFARSGPNSSADLSDHLHNVCAAFRSIYSDKINLVEDLSPGCGVHPDQVLPLTQIIAEVITNAIKHADPSSQTGRIVVRARKDLKQTLTVEVADNGPGFPDTLSPGADDGLGFRLMRELGKQVRAAMEFESSSGGLLFRLTLPVPAPAPGTHTSC